MLLALTLLVGLLGIAYAPNPSTCDACQNPSHMGTDSLSSTTQESELIDCCVRCTEWNANNGSPECLAFSWKPPSGGSENGPCKIHDGYTCVNNGDAANWSFYRLKDSTNVSCEMCSSLADDPHFDTLDGERYDLRDMSLKDSSDPTARAKYQLIRTVQCQPNADLVKKSKFPAFDITMVPGNKFYHGHSMIERLEIRFFWSKLFPHQGNNVEIFVEQLDDKRIAAPVILVNGKAIEERKVCSLKNCAPGSVDLIVEQYMNKSQIVIGIPHYNLQLSYTGGRHHKFDILSINSQLTAVLKGNVAGLLGNFNGIPEDDTLCADETKSGYGCWEITNDGSKNPLKQSKESQFFQCQAE